MEGMEDGEEGERPGGPSQRKKQRSALYHGKFICDVPECGYRVSVTVSTRAILVHTCPALTNPLLHPLQTIRRTHFTKHINIRHAEAPPPFHCPILGCPYKSRASADTRRHCIGHHKIEATTYDETLREKVSEEGGARLAEARLAEARLAETRLAEARLALPPLPTAPNGNAGTYTAWWDPCPVCNQIEGALERLVCDSCEGEWHMQCIDVTSVPDGDWFCMVCAQDGIGVGEGVKKRADPKCDEAMQKPKRKRDRETDRETKRRRRDIKTQPGAEGAAPRGKRKCAGCGRRGHDKRNCPLMGYKGRAKEGEVVATTKQHNAVVHGVDVVWHACTENNCEYKAKLKQNLKVHRANVHGIVSEPAKRADGDLKAEADIEHGPAAEGGCGIEGCAYKTDDAHRLKRHRSNVHDVKGAVFTCSVLGCGYVAKNKGLLSSHKAQVHDIVWKRCPHCEYKTLEVAGKSALDAHIKSRHAIKPVAKGIEPALVKPVAKGIQLALVPTRPEPQTPENWKDVMSYCYNTGTRILDVSFRAGTQSLGLSFTRVPSAAGFVLSRIESSSPLYRVHPLVAVGSVLRALNGVTVGDGADDIERIQEAKMSGLTFKLQFLLVDQLGEEKREPLKAPAFLAFEELKKKEVLKAQARLACLAAEVEASQEDAATRSDVEAPDGDSTGGASAGELGIFDAKGFGSTIDDPAKQSDKEGALEVLDAFGEQEQQAVTEALERRLAAFEEEKKRELLKYEEERKKELLQVQALLASDEKKKKKTELQNSTGVRDEPVMEMTGASEQPARKKKRKRGGILVQYVKATSGESEPDVASVKEGTASAKHVVKKIKGGIFVDYVEAVTSEAKMI